MAVSTEEAIIIGCIVGIAVLIVFGLLLWYFCSKRTRKIGDTNYDQLPQNEQERGAIESPKDTENNITPKILISVQNSINTDKNEAICDYQVECKKEEDDDASHLDVVNGLLSKSKTVSVESMEEEKTTINAAKTVENTKAGNDGSVEHKLETVDKSIVLEQTENDKKEDIMDKAAIINKENEEKRDIVVVKAEDDQKKEEKIEKDVVVVNDRKHDDEEKKEDDEEMDADKAEKDAVNDRKEEEDKKEDVEDIEADHDKAEIDIIDDKKKEEIKDIEAVQRTEDVNDADKEEEDAYDHDIEDENKDIIKPLNDDKTKQQLSTLSTATSSSVLSTDSNANVFGNRWNDSQRGFEWTEDDKPIRDDKPIETDDNTETVNKNKDVTTENN